MSTFVKNYDMNLRQRLFRYLTGVLIGLLFVFFFFGNRSCTDWMPNKRVLKRLSETELIVSRKARCQMDCMQLNDEDIRFIISNGNVDFKASDTESIPLRYILDVQRDENKSYRMEFIAADSTSTLDEVSLKGFSGNCNCQ